MHRSILVVLSSALVACADPEGNGATPNDASPEVEGAPDVGVAPDVGIDEIATPDTAFDCKVAAADGTICSCTEVGQDPPTLYLVLDRSGSMVEIPPGSTRSKWHMVRDALVGTNGVPRKLGSRIKIAVTWFPSPSVYDWCNSGREIIHPTIGNPATYDELEAKLASAVPRGATPTAAALHIVRTAISKLTGPVHVLLATDGAPNCGTTTCTADMCTYNVDNASTPACVPSFNCCDPANMPVGMGWRACIDSAATTQAANAIVGAGSKLFVVGVPGTTSAYAAHLDAIAAAGGAPNDGPTKYWAPTDATSLTAALSTIAARAIDSCEVRLDAPIVDPGVTNVLLDGEVIAADKWTWTSPSTIELMGDACDRVHAGTVTRVSVAVGCKTVTR